MYGITCRVARRLAGYEKKAVCRLLDRFGLAFEGTPDYTAIAEDSEENIIATASLSGSVIKMVAADPQWQDAGLSATVISALLRTANADGIYHLFLYTKPEMSVKFAGLGFRGLAATPDAVLMECGMPGIDDYRRTLETYREQNGAGASAAVMNCNPFTLGHRWLIENAAAASGVFYVIVVEEDASVFPFADRLELVRKGTADIPGVRVIPSSHYAVSSATFPTYFLKDRGEISVAKVQARLDASLFASLYVPALGIERRFVGTEPFSAVTAVYNEALKEILPPSGCAVTELERKTEGGEAISASRVRELLKCGDISAVSRLVPSSTMEYLRSERGAAATQKLRDRK